MGFARRNTEVSCHFLLHGLPWRLRWQSMCLQCRRPGFNPWVGKIPWRRKWQPTPVLLPGKFHGWRSLVGYSLWGRKESNTTEQLHFLSFSRDLPEPEIKPVSPAMAGRFFYHWATWEALDNSISRRFPELFCRCDPHPHPPCLPRKGRTTWWPWAHSPRPPGA